MLLKSWNLRGNGESADLKAVSQRHFPLDLGAAGKYQLEFGEFRMFNVESAETQNAYNPEAQKDARSVNQTKRFNNVGPTITYKIRDTAGQAREYLNYMLPLNREGRLYYTIGERSDVNSNYFWLMMPADPNGKMDSFMAFRNFLVQPEKRTALLQRLIANVDENKRETFKQAVENLLAQFTTGGYLAINNHIKQHVPPEAQEQTAQVMYQILHSAMDMALSEALQAAQLPDIPAGETREAFLQSTMSAYTDLSHFHNPPILLQLQSFKQVNMSGLQMTKSPGAGLVYLGSLFLVLGVFFMFYVREKRAWLLFGNDGAVRFAMSSSRNERDLTREFPEHVQKLDTLVRDLNLKN